MKIIEGLKQIKELSRKADDIKEKISKHSAYLNFETPMYKDQKGQVNEWLQAYSDILKEILRLRISIQRTNLAVEVEVVLGEKTIKKTIAEWIHRRRDLATLEKSVWAMLTDRNLKEGVAEQSTGEKMDIKIVRCYEAEERDKKIDLFSGEPSTIDSRLEVVNAITDLMED